MGCDLDRFVREVSFRSREPLLVDDTTRPPYIGEPGWWPRSVASGAMVSAMCVW